MTYKAFSNKQHIKRSIWVYFLTKINYFYMFTTPQKIPADPHFQTLESDLEADNFTFLRAPPLASATNSANGSMIPCPNTPGPTSIDPTSNAAPRPSFLQPPLLYNARIVQSSSYNFFTYDPLTESAAGNN